ncbi:hypothetical protein [Bradyrhizobium sp. RDM4]|uniref:hypothetical protein n=1 Tax=Bradyrhizobium sp. RDM4 TaxID=3378765 RepID=UPI0038FC2245
MIVLRNITQSPAWKRSTHQSSASLMSLGHSSQAFRNKCRHIALKQAASHSASRSQKGKITVTNRDPFAEGESAARDNIPAEAIPYQDGSDEHALWAAGHEKIASAREARESEGS